MSEAKRGIHLSGPCRPMEPFQLVGLDLRSALFQQAEQCWLVGELWKRLRTYGHAPLLTYLSDKPLGSVRDHLPALGLEPDFLICLGGEEIYDCSNQRIWEELTAALPPKSLSEAFDRLCEGLEISPEAALLLGPDCPSNVIADRIMRESPSGVRAGG